MEQESVKETRPARSLTLGRFRFFVCLVATVCVLSCTVALFISLSSLKSLESRLATVESKLNAISKESKQSPSETEMRELLSVRHKRDAIPPQVSLADLTMRIIALEVR